MRDLGAILAGLAATLAAVALATWLATLVLIGGPDPWSARPTPAYLVVNLTLSTLAAVLGGWITARLARGRPMQRVYILAGLLLLLGLPNLFAEPAAMRRPSWYPIALLVLGPLGILSGGWLRSRTAGS